MLDYIFALTGLIATIWISLGVYIAAKFYPNYDHSNQFCSELGAKGSPTEKLSPMINNYPLGIIFCAFGLYLTYVFQAHSLMVAAGILIVIHGVGTWIAGFFPMDKDPYTKTPSFSCKVHSWAGFIMLLSLLVAPILVTLSSESIFIPTWFRVLSIVTVVSSIYYLVKMAQAVKTKQLVGVYQRVSYWIKLVWLSVFSLILTQI